MQVQAVVVVVDAVVVVVAFVVVRGSSICGVLKQPRDDGNTKKSASMAIFVYIFVSIS
jgi:hypothetical protein